MDKEESCECCCEEEKEKSMGGMTMEIADKAWMKVLQRKLEAMIEKSQGKELDKVAKITYDHAKVFYDMKMAGKELSTGATEEFEKRLMAAMQG